MEKFKRAILRLLYPGLIIYASAAFTFYSLIIAMINMVKFRKLDNPALSAAKMLSFAGVLMSILTLGAV